MWTNGARNIVQQRIYVRFAHFCATSYIRRTLCEVFFTKGLNMEYDFDSIEEQEAHFELIQDSFLRKERAKYIVQKSLSGSSSTKSCNTCAHKDEDSTESPCRHCSHNYFSCHVSQDF